MFVITIRYKCSMSTNFSKISIEWKMVTFAKCFSNYTCFVHADHDGALQWNPHFGNEDRYDIEGRYGTEDFINTHTHIHTHIWPFNNVEFRGTDPLQSLGCMYNFTISTPCPRLHSHSFNQPESCSTVICIYWKNSHISGSVQFKPILFNI